MSALRSLLPTGRAALIAIDTLMAAWVALWIVLAIAIGHEVHGLRQLSGTVTRVGVAVEQTGQTLEGIGAVPLIGDRVGTTAKEITAAGRSTVQSGRTSRDSIRRLSWMLALVLAVAPTVPLLLLYVPLRVASERERRALRRLVAGRESDPVLRRLLAQRALLTSPYQQLMDADGDPVDAARGERLEKLAEAELERLGVARSRRR
jgi:hypothetical protein